MKKWMIFAFFALFFAQTKADGIVDDFSIERIKILKDDAGNPIFMTAFQMGQFGCPVDTKRVVHINVPLRKIFLGCWSFVNPSTIKIEFEDGDVHEIKIAERDL